MTGESNEGGNHFFTRRRALTLCSGAVVAAALTLSEDTRRVAGNVFRHIANDAVGLAAGDEPINVTQNRQFTVEAEAYVIADIKVGDSHGSRRMRCTGGPARLLGPGDARHRSLPETICLA